MEGKDGLAIFGEQHEVGFPMAGALAIAGGGRPVGDGQAAGDEVDGAAALPSASAALELCSGQEAAPATVIGAGDLRIDEAVDAFMADARLTALQRQAAGHLLWRQSCAEPGENLLPQRRMTLQTRSLPAACRGALLCHDRFVRFGCRPVALQFPANGRWRAIQTCSDLPDRQPLVLKTGNLDPVIQ